MGLNGVVQIAAGANYSLALKSDGTVVAWGEFTPTVPSGKNIKEVQANGLFSCVLTDTGGFLLDNPYASEPMVPSAIEANLFKDVASIDVSYLIANSTTIPDPTAFFIDYDNTFIRSTDEGVATDQTAWLYSGLNIETADVVIRLWKLPEIVENQVFSGSVGTSFSSPQAQSIQLVDSVDGPATNFSVGSGFPSWATLNSTTGAITGIPTISTTYSFTVSTAGPGGSSQKTAQIVIASGPPIVTAGQNYTTGVGTSFSQAIQLTDSVNRPAVLWAATGLPSGLTINTNTGEISGTPTTRGNYTSTVTATGSGASSPTQVNFTITDGSPIIVEGQTIEAKKSTSIFSQSTIQLSDSTNRRVTSWSASGLPAGVSINSTTGVLSGPPTQVGNFSAIITAAGVGGTDAKTVNFIIVLAAPELVKDQTFEFSYQQSMSVYPGLVDSANSPGTSWSATGLPPGLSINSKTGQITGVASLAGVYDTNINVSNIAGSDSQTFFFSVTSANTALNGVNLTTDTLDFGACVIENELTTVKYASQIFMGGTRIWNSTLNAKKITVGHNFNLGLNWDNRVVGWGTNDFGQLTFPTSVRKPGNVLDVAASNRTCVALLANGSVVSWGQQSVLLPSAATLAGTIKLYAFWGADYTGNAGGGRGGVTCFAALKSDGTFVTWGQTAPYNVTWTTSNGTIAIANIPSDWNTGGVTDIGFFKADLYAYKASEKLLIKFPFNSNIGASPSVVATNVEKAFIKQGQSIAYVNTQGIFTLLNVSLPSQDSVWDYPQINWLDVTECVMSYRLAAALRSDGSLTVWPVGTVDNVIPASEGGFTSVWYNGAIPGANGFYATRPKLNRYEVLGNSVPTGISGLI